MKQTFIAMKGKKKGGKKQRGEKKDVYILKMNDWGSS